MRVAVYGGSFNPPHLAHQLAMTCVLATARVDELWMVPTFQHPFDKPLAPFADRVRMCELAAAPFSRVRVERVEEQLGGASYTLRTMQALRARHPEHQFALVIGGDLVEERQRWHGWSELERLVPFIVIGRVGTPQGAPEQLQLPPVSSTDVRRRVAAGQAIDGLVAAEVADYVRQRGLYREATP